MQTQERLNYGADLALAYVDVLANPIEVSTECRTMSVAICWARCSPSSSSTLMTTPLSSIASAPK